MSGPRPWSWQLQHVVFPGTAQGVDPAPRAHARRDRFDPALSHRGGHGPIRRQPEALVLLHHLGEWRVPLRAGGRSYAIVGSLDYKVSDGGIADLLFPLAPVPLLALLAAGIVRQTRRGSSSDSQMKFV